MAWGRITLHLDRDDVAMGDSMPKRVAKEAPAGILVSAAIAKYSITVGGPDWVWVALVDGEVAAVWSTGEGVKLLVPDRKLEHGPVEIFYRYFTQMDATWLYNQLASGTPANRWDLRQAYADHIERNHFRPLSEDA
ncbi:hypothetical protein ACQUSY_09500 [Microbacterium sp. YY-03]|uniref:hypothetical protein n=1 Tax=Microbacterium sp. YY-03 TaxID=3421636 RepID=UPI003D18059F